MYRVYDLKEGVSKEGRMFGTLRDILIHTTEESIAILLSLSSILFVFLMIYWQYNRRRFRKLSHQIPAGVVRDYLDSVIQNSSALKSSLFLGGESGTGRASVVLVERLSGSGGGDDHFEDLNRKNAEIAELRDGIAIKDKIIAELENKLEAARSGEDSGLLGESKALQSKVERLKKELEQQSLGGSVSKDELKKLIKERDALRDSLKEYEIIEDDLANLKNLQEENKRYQRMIEDMGGSLPTDIPDPLSQDEEKIPEIPETKKEIKRENKQENKKEDKVASNSDNPDSEELLKEFEKMLG